MKRHNILISGLILTCFISAVGFLYSKNVQAGKLTSEWKTSPQYNNDDEIVKEKGDNLTKEQYETLKSSYLADSITYDEFNSKADALKGLDSFNEYKNERQAVEKIESFRSIYRMAQTAVSNKDYKGALDALKKIENDIDEVYKNKLNKFKTEIDNLVLKEKENAVSSISSKTSFLVWVDIHTQSTNIFTGSKGKWKLLHSFLSSTGEPGNETPKGTYTIKDKGNWFFSQKYQEGAKYWVRFKGNYLFHSLPMNQDKKVVDPTLGEPASHGCVRLSLDDAAWFYNNIPTKTTVYIK
jgi:lipoprotein-anchoring transpeptidase ErfK/SrfK